MKQKLTLEYTRITKDSEEKLKVEYESEEQVNPSLQKIAGLVSAYLPAIVKVTINFFLEILTNL